MPIPEIIDEIDAYLSRLHQARELLLGRSTEAPQKSTPSRKPKAKLSQADLASSRRTAKNKPRSNQPAAHLKREGERVDVGVQVPSPVTHSASDSEPPAIARSERAVLTNVVIKRLPSKGPRTSIRFMRRRTQKPAAPTPDSAKAAIVLAGPVNNKIVVVPAEQVRRERAAHAEVPRRPRVPASGLTGRLAFEALFK